MTNQLKVTSPQASLLQEYTVGQATAGDEGCRRMDGHRKSILKKHQGSDSSPDLIPHVDQGDIMSNKTKGFFFMFN